MLQCSTIENVNPFPTLERGVRGDLNLFLLRQLPMSIDLEKYFKVH